MHKIFNLEYGTYTCVKNGKTCEYDLYDDELDKEGELCPGAKVGEKADLYYDRAYKLLTSNYCSFTRKKIKKYVCLYDFEELIVYRKNNEVFCVIGDFPTDKNLKYAYNPFLCRRITVKNPRSKYNKSNRIKNTNTQKEYVNNNYIPIKIRFLYELIIIVLIIMIIATTIGRCDDDPNHKLK